jgi:hypothetical protein
VIKKLREISEKRRKAADSAAQRRKGARFFCNLFVTSFLPQSGNGQKKKQQPASLALPGAFCEP